MKKTKIFLRLAACFALAFSALLFSCADSAGLHNLNALKAKIKFTNFGDLSGDFVITGDFNGWQSEETNIVMSGGEGESSAAFSITNAWPKFSLISKGDWSRGIWFPKIQGNVADGGSGNRNFIVEVDINCASATIVVDGSKSGQDDMVYVE